MSSKTICNAITGIEDVQTASPKVIAGKGKAQQVNMTDTDNEDQGHLRHCANASDKT